MQGRSVCSLRERRRQVDQDLQIAVPNALLKTGAEGLVGFLDPVEEKQRDPTEVAVVAV